MSERALYAIAAAVYIGVGSVVPELLFSWLEGAAFLLLAVWILPSLLQRLWR